ncbi:MAG TPA: 2-succinyl-5-enolpyruvyl-6-hydroxy-3-cyclohexene-1-carboxylic-acid synthase [Ktedonobacterales bacterium]|nr:2-succinyl-5-enolpyruvyl-6-hydroxy-3-cyclohexene-1-carboxylic-acid synthase [Ktedonobacterales bacterium]
MANPRYVEPVNALYAYVGAFADELTRAGAHHVVVCPGSRSTPLALAFAAQPNLRVWMHVDERSAAFFALGMAKRLGAPVALLCTSGTAAANFYPAIVEAKLTHVPLLALTADRPPELREVGAPQAIDQNHLYGAHVKWYAEAALPEATNAALRYVRALADRAVALTQAIPAGPVHLNFPFREPLAPEPGPLPLLGERDHDAWQGRPDGAPYTRVTNAPLAAPDPATLARLAETLQANPRGLLVVGPLGLREAEALTEPLLALAARLGYPILADPLSQLRTLPAGVADQQMIISSYDAFLRSERFVSAMEPQVVVRFGAMPVSKPLLLYLQRYPQARQIVVDGAGDWPEPTLLAAEIIHADPTAVCAGLTPRPPSHTYGKGGMMGAVGVGEDDAGVGEWLAMWAKAERATEKALIAAHEEMQGLFEGFVFSELAGEIQEPMTLCVGNSMPVRDLDSFFRSAEYPTRIIGNRGANGIDGVVSTALGASAAERVIGEASAHGGRAPRQRVALVIGDLSLYHDMNGLLAARLHDLDLTIILVNNDGGGIFSFLPQANYPDHFETLFGTPTGLDFRQVARLYDAHYTRATTWEDFRHALSDRLNGAGLSIVEVTTDRARNVTLHRQLWDAVEQAIAPVLGATRRDAPNEVGAV